MRHILLAVLTTVRLHPPFWSLKLAVAFIWSDAFRSLCVNFVMCVILCKCVEKTWNSSSSTTVFTTTCFVFVFPLTAVKTTLFCCSASEWLLMLFRTDCYEVVFFCLPNGKPIKKGAPLMCAIMPFVSYEILLHLEVAG